MLLISQRISRCLITYPSASCCRVPTRVMMHDAREKQESSSSRVQVDIQLLTLQPPLSVLMNQHVQAHNAREQACCADAEAAELRPRIALRCRALRVPVRCACACAQRVCLCAPGGRCIRQPMHTANRSRPHVPPAARRREDLRESVSSSHPFPSPFLFLPLAGFAGGRRRSTSGSAYASRTRPPAHSATAACDQ